MRTRQTVTSRFPVLVSHGCVSDVWAGHVWCVQLSYHCRQRAAAQPSWQPLKSSRCIDVMKRLVWVSCGSAHPHDCARLDQKLQGTGWIASGPCMVSGRVLLILQEGCSNVALEHLGVWTMPPIQSLL